MSHSNLEVVKGIYAAFANGDVPAVLAGLSADIEWTEAAGFPLAGTYIGHDAVVTGVFMPLATRWEGFAVALEEYVDGGDTIVALGKYSGKYLATGKNFVAEFAHVWKLRNGKAYRFHQYVDSAKVNEALT